jgi:hypothetical protein
MPTKIRAKDDGSVDVGDRHRGISPRGAKCFAPRAGARAPDLQRDVTRLCERASKVAANVGMGDSNQGLGALAQAEPEQIHNAVFGDDPVNMSTRGHHTSAGFQ